MKAQNIEIDEETVSDMAQQRYPHLLGSRKDTLEDLNNS